MKKTNLLLNTCPFRNQADALRKQLVNKVKHLFTEEGNV